MNITTLRIRLEGRKQHLTDILMKTAFLNRCVLTGVFLISERVSGWRTVYELK